MPRSPSRPAKNILLILTDQQNWRMMSCMGNPHVRTPAMDELAARGKRFHRTYCANPVCVPSRFSLFTGRLSTEIGLHGNVSRDIPPVPHAIKQGAIGWLLREAGYDTVYGGKVHLPKIRIEEAARVPFIIVDPSEVDPGSVDDSSVVSNGLDLLPTICDYANAKVPHGLSGRSLRLLAKGDPSAWDREYVPMVGEIGSAVVSRQWKYARYDDGAPTEQLVDLRRDPGERVNLAGRPDQQQALDRCRDVWHALRNCSLA